MFLFIYMHIYIYIQGDELSKLGMEMSRQEKESKRAGTGIRQKY